MRIYIVFFSWQCGGIETRAIRFFENIKYYTNYECKLISVTYSGKLQKGVLQYKNLLVFSRKNFTSFLKGEKLKKEDVFFLFRPGSNNDKSFFEKRNGELPFYFDYFNIIEEAKKVVYIYGNSETQQLVYYPEIIKRFDFVASSFLVEKDRKNFLIKDPFKKETRAFIKPIWWFNISLSNTEKEIVKYNIKNIKELDGRKKVNTVIFTGRITPEKNISRIIKSYLYLSKKKFECFLYGTRNFSREDWYIEQKYGKGSFENFYYGEYNGIKDSKKILFDKNFGINLRKKNNEFNHVIEQTTLEYMYSGVIPIISENFLPNKRNTDYKFFVYNEEKENNTDIISEFILDNYNSKELIEYRKQNLIYLLKENDPKKVIKSFLNFIENL